MGLAFAILMLLLMGPAAVLYGADSRRESDRGWLARRHRS
jgi:hypothetical protein